MALKVISDSSQQLQRSNLFDGIDSKKLHIIHIKQDHGFVSDLFGVKDFNPSTDMIEKTVQSQLNIAKIIGEHPNCPVVIEGLSKNMTIENLELSKEQREKYRNVREKSFPNGLPRDPSTLSNGMKNLIYHLGSPRVLLVFGDIPVLYKSAHEEVGEKWNQEMESGNFSCAFGPREKETLACAKEAAINHYGNLDKVDQCPVLLVFGAHHNFKPHCDELGFSHESIDTTEEYINACIPYDVGFGNTLGVRSELSWQTTEAFTWTPQGWAGRIPMKKEFKFVIVSNTGEITWEKRETNRFLHEESFATDIKLHF